MSQTRRHFVRNVSTAASAMAVYPILPVGLSNQIRPFRKQTRTVSPSDKISFGVIGCNGMGFGDTRSLLRIPETRCLAVCDVDRRVAERRANDLIALGGPAPKVHGDYRRVLEDPDLDFVVIGTPDHWHCLITVEALEAGKHVYVEKPMANTIEECNVMLGASRAHDRVVQLGQWQRSGPHWEAAVAFVKSGALGNIRTVKTWAYQGWMKPVPVLPDTDAPPGVDYDMWLGPAKKRPFNRNRFHFSFRWFWDYAGGLMTDWGVHIIDFALYGMDAPFPKSVMASGGKFAYPDDASETPDTLQAIYEFDNFTMLWEHATGIDLGPYGRTHGVAFIGNNGTLVVDRGGWEVIAEEENDPEFRASVPLVAVPEPRPQQGSDLDRHTVNFVNSMKGEETPNAGAEVGHKTAVVAHMGNIAYKTGRKLYWDGDRFRDDLPANDLMSPVYRDPWKLPDY